MIQRYTRPEMGALWTQEARFQCLLEVETAVARAQSELGLIPKKAAEDIATKGRFSVERIDEIERTTKHDVIAFVSCVAEAVGENGRYIHYGMTSSDVLDTALSLQIQKAFAVLKDSYSRLDKALRQKIEAHVDTLCAGRTHGMHAEATTFGLKLCGHWVEFQRAMKRVTEAVEDLRIGKLSGAVGTYSTQPPEVEARVCEMLNLKPETIATQVVPRDRHAEVMCAISLMGAAIERLAVELRHLQRTEVGEVIEGFTPGQKGSSAMPHKKNPISAENLTGVARLLRGYMVAAVENVALWHERDISHSSVERVAIPDAFIILDYALDRLARVMDGLYVNAERMKANMDLSQGQLMSSQVLLALIDLGQSREEAYKVVQGLCHGLQPGQHLRRILEEKKLLKLDVLQRIFEGEAVKKNARRLVDRAMKGH